MWPCGILKCLPMQQASRVAGRHTASGWTAIGSRLSARQLSTAQQPVSTIAHNVAASPQVDARVYHVRRVKLTGVPKEEGWPTAEQLLARCRTRPGQPVTFQVTACRPRVGAELLRAWPGRNR